MYLIFYFAPEQYEKQNFCENLLCNNIISNFTETKERIIHFYGMQTHFTNCAGLRFITHPDITSS